MRNGVAQKEGQESHKVLFENLIADFKTSVVSDVIYHQSKKDDRTERIFSLFLKNVVISFALTGMYLSYQEGDPIISAQGASIVFAGMACYCLAFFPTSLAWVLGSIIYKERTDKECVTAFLYQNDEIAKQYFLKFIASVNRRSQPRLVGCNPENIQGIYIVCDFNNSRFFDDVFNIIGYYKLDNCTAKIELKLRLENSYQAAYVKEYTISHI